MATIRATIMYIKIHNNLSPPYLRRIFTITSNVHIHNLRNSEINCYVSNPRTGYGKPALQRICSVEQDSIGNFKPIQFKTV